MAINKNKKILISLICAAVFSVISIYVLCAFASIREIWFYDFKGQWAISAYFFKGVDPFVLTGTEQIPDVSIGAVPKYFGTVPWALLLGNLIYGGFLPYVYARFLISKQLDTENKAVRILTFLLSFLSINSFVSVLYGNAGVICCALLIIAIIKIDKNPIILGVCLAVAMIKPQVALLFCFEFLLLKKIKPLIIAASIDVFAYAAVCFILKKSPVILLKEFLSIDIGNQNRNVGLFTFLKYMGTSDNFAMLLSMATGIAFVIILHFKTQDGIPMLYRFIPVCIAETFWCYSWWNDQFVMIVPALSCIVLMLADNGRHNILKQSAFLFLCLFKQSLIFINALPIASAYPENTNLFFTLWNYENSVITLILIAICIYNLKRLAAVYSRKQIDKGKALLNN